MVDLPTLKDLAPHTWYYQLAVMDQGRQILIVSRDTTVDLCLINPGEDSIRFADGLTLTGVKDLCADRIEYGYAVFVFSNSTLTLWLKDEVRAEKPDTWPVHVAREHRRVFSAVTH